MSKEFIKKFKGIKPKTWKLRPEVLLCPNVPKPMHGMAPRVVLGGKWWNATRQKAYKTTAFHCVACGIHKSKARGKHWLEGHELYDIDYKKGLMTYLETIPLCHFCHNYIHDGRMLSLMQKGKFHSGKYKLIIQHGDKVLWNEDLKKLTHKEREEEFLDMSLNNQVAEWSSWRLVIGKKKYEPKFKTEYQWRQAFKK